MNIMGETTNGKDTGATDADASKAPAQPPQSDVEEAHILKSTSWCRFRRRHHLPVPAIPAVPSGAPTPLLAPSLPREIIDVPKPAGYIQSILGKIKLPDRRASEMPVKPAQVYDTSLTAKPEAEK